MRLFYFLAAREAETGDVIAQAQRAGSNAASS
jgi:hypothetical protein